MAIVSGAAIHETEGLALTRGGLILIALLCGGDYDQVSCVFYYQHFKLHSDHFCYSLAYPALAWPSHMVWRDTGSEMSSTLQ